MTKVIQGAAQEVIVIENSDLVENGGRYEITGKTVLPVEFVEDDDSTLRRLGGGAMFVYIIEDEQILSGEYKLIGGAAMKVVEVTP